MDIPVYCIIDRPAQARPDCLYFYVFDMDALRRDVRAELSRALSQGYSYRGFSHGYDSEVGEFFSYQYGRGRQQRWFVLPVDAVR